MVSSPLYSRVSLWARWLSMEKAARTAAMIAMVRATRLLNGSWAACCACSACSRCCSVPCPMVQVLCERLNGTAPAAFGAPGRTVPVF